MSIWLCLGVDYVKRPFLHSLYGSYGPRPKCCCLATRSLTSLDAWGLRWKPTGGLITLHHGIWKGQRELSSFYLFSSTPPRGPSVSLVRTHAKLKAETKHRFHDDLSHYRKYSRDRTTFLLEDFNVRAGTNHHSRLYSLSHFGTG